jgi:hypothetical protein
MAELRTKPIKTTLNVERPLFIKSSCFCIFQDPLNEVRTRDSQTIKTLVFFKEYQLVLRTSRTVKLSLQA